MIGATAYSDCYCTPDPLACSYNSKLLSRDYHYQQSCEPNVGTTGGASVMARSRRVGGGSVGPLSVVELCSSSVLLRHVSNFMKNNCFLGMEHAAVTKITRSPYVRT